MLGSFKVVIIVAACGSSLLAAHGPMHGHHEDKKIGGSRGEGLTTVLEALEGKLRIYRWWCCCLVTDGEWKKERSLLRKNKREGRNKAAIMRGKAKTGVEDEDEGSGFSGEELEEDKVT
uniref:Uncharacterized protein n=1 Tax=Populus trichocarpa TaxID=3694 RepID=A0A2K2BM33_POPTR